MSAVLKWWTLSITSCTCTSTQTLVKLLLWVALSCIVCLLMCWLLDRCPPPRRKKQEKERSVSVVADLRQTSLAATKFIAETLLLLEVCQLFSSHFDLSGHNDEQKCLWMCLWRLTDLSPEVCPSPKWFPRSWLLCKLPPQWWTLCYHLFFVWQRRNKKTITWPWCRFLTVFLHVHRLNRSSVKVCFVCKTNRTCFSFYASNACKCLSRFFFLISPPFQMKDYYVEFPPLPERSVTKGFISHVMIFCDTHLFSQWSPSNCPAERQWQRQLPYPPPPPPTSSRFLFPYFFFLLTWSKFFSTGSSHHLYIYFLHFYKDIRSCFCTSVFCISAV